MSQPHSYSDVGFDSWSAIVWTLHLLFVQMRMGKASRRQRVAKTTAE